MTKLYKQFDNWFHELEGHASRSERCYDDYDSSKAIAPFKNLRNWLEAAFLAGRMETTYTLEVLEDQHGVYLQFPKELLAQTGWTAGTTLLWHDNGDGSWTLKAKK